MPKIKNQKLANILIIFVIFTLFWIGNRIGLIYLVQKEQGASEVQAILLAFSDIANSMDSSYLGLHISFQFIPILVGIAMLAIPYFYMMWRLENRKNYKIGEEHGSARYGKVIEETKDLKDEKEDNNMLFSNNIHISMDTRKTFLNNNVLIIGGSGAGKTRYFAKPNILQMNCNYIITDPKGSLIPEVGNAFKQAGYDIKIVNLVDMEKSMKYNPLKYINKPNDVLKFINNLVENTSKDNANSGGDDFFVKAEIAFLTALVFYVLACGKEEEKNMNTVMDLIDLAEASEEDENAESVLDIMFEFLSKINQEQKEKGTLNKHAYGYLAERQYKLYKKAAGKTAKSILISVGVRMSVFNIPEVEQLLSTDELELQSFGKPKKDKNGKDIKTVLFVVISDSDSTFSFLAGILYQQLYDMLYMIADGNPGGRLPIHTRFIQDEFANVGKQKDFEIKIATMRSREISVCVILQNLAQLKNLYKDSWETIMGNCDTTVFLGGKEGTTLEALSKLIGNTTIDYLSISETKGSNGSWSTSNQLISRPLLAPDEIGRLKPDECLVHIRGKHIFKDKKYDLSQHKRLEHTTDALDKEKAKRNIFQQEDYIKTFRSEKREEIVEKGTLNQEKIQEENTLYFTNVN